MEPLARVTETTVLVLICLYTSEQEDLWGFEIVRKTGLKTGTVYPILDRLESLGWVTSEWETENDRPGARRRTYRLTDDAVYACQELLATKSSKQARTNARSRIAESLKPANYPQ
jgi:PadR family transcriptional regulator, regulatory protein PadR